MNDHSRSLRTLTVAAIAALLLTAPLGAQELASATPVSRDSAVAAAPVPVSAGPTMDAASVGVRSNFVATAPAPMAAGHSQGQPVAMMVVGGAAIIAGAIVGGGGGYAISVGGAVIGLIGLYQYLQ